MTPYAAKLVTSAALCGSSLAAAAISARPERVGGASASLPEGQLWVLLLACFVCIVAGAVWVVTLLAGSPKQTPPPGN